MVRIVIAVKDNEGIVLLYSKCCAFSAKSPLKGAATTLKSTVNKLENQQDNLCNMDICRSTRFRQVYQHLQNEVANSGSLEYIANYL